MKIFMSSLWVALVICLLGGVTPAMTVEVDPATANGTTIFSTIPAAARYIHTNNDAGVADTINVMVDTLSNNDTTTNLVQIDWYDDVTINGDGDGNGTWCTLVLDDTYSTLGVGNTEYGYVRLYFPSASQAWGANFVLKNFIIIPKFKSAGGSTLATSLNGFFTASWSATPTSTSGTMTLENLVVTGSLTGDVPANPFANQRASATNWQRGIHLGSRNTATTSRRTVMTVKNTIISYVVNEGVKWYGDDIDATFGPGFVMSNVIGTNCFAPQTSGLNCHFRIVGDPANRNLFTLIGDATGDRVINLESASGPAVTGCDLAEVSYSDFISNTARHAMRVAGGPLRLVDNCLFAEAQNSGAGSIETVSAIINTAPMVISNTTFFNLASAASARHIMNIYTTTQTLSNVVFGAGTGEADVTSTTTDMAMNLVGSKIDLNYCLFPESGPNRLHPPYDTVFPPSPVNDATYINPFGSVTGFTLSNCQNVDPQFISTNVVDYPLPASIAAWQAGKITLTTCNYLRPGNAALVMTGPEGKDLLGVYTSYTPVELSSFATE
jgi:hypothetical protein